MNDSNRFERNLGFLSGEEQMKIENAVVGIAGVGGDGALLAINLARMGVQEFRLADPDPFEIENTNRQAGCEAETIGLNKASVIAGKITAINPDAKVTLYEEGIKPDNIPEFVTGATLIIDETEFTLHALGIMLARESRNHNLPMLTAFNVGFGAVATTFHPQGKTLEKVLGFSESQSIEEISKSQVELSRWLPYLPKYGDIKVLKQVAEGRSAPSIAPGVAMAAGLAATQAMLNIVGTSNNRPKPAYAPKAHMIDVMSMEAKVINFSKASHYKYLARAVVNNLFGKNPTANY